jgi:prolyl-tRNA synthetase
VHVVIVPIYRKEEEKQAVLAAAHDLAARVRAVDFKDWLNYEPLTVRVDDRDQYQPGYKFNEWELRGVPLRLEIGPKDIEKSQVVLARRDTREKSFTPMDGLAAHTETLLNTIQQALFDRAVAFRREHTTEAESYATFIEVMEAVPVRSRSWRGRLARGVDRAETQATIRNILLASPPATENRRQVR